MEDPSKEPVEVSFRQKVCLLAKVHEDEKTRKYIEKGVKKMEEQFDMFKILGNIQNLQPVKEEEEGKGKEDKQETKENLENEGSGVALVKEN